MEIPTNMHLLIFLVACVLFTTTECATSYQDCPGYVEKGTVGVLTCVGYSTSEITWEFMSGQSSFSTIGKCTSSSTCTLEPTYTNAGLFVLTAITGTSSQLNLTTKYTAGPKTVTFACDGVNCVVNIAEPTTTEMPTTTPEATTETTEETTGTGEPSSSTPVETTGAEEPSSSSPPDTPADTETSLTMSNNSTTPAVSTESPTTTDGKNENATNRNESPHRYVAVYVGAGFAGLVVVIVVVAVVVLRMRSSKKKARTMTNDQATNGATSARGRDGPREDTRM